MSTPYTPFQVVDIQDGIRTDTASFLIPDTATPSMLNATHFRGRIVEKGGDQLLCNPVNINDRFRGRLGIRNNTGSVTDSGGFAVVSAGTSIYAGAVDPGTVRVTVGGFTVIDNGIDGHFVAYPIGTPGVVTGQINYITGSIISDVTGFGAYVALSKWTSSVWLVPSASSCAMGAANIDVKASAAQNMMAFDTLKPYIFDAVNDQFQLADRYESSDLANVITFNGTDSQFFWCLNYEDSFWITNGNPGFQGVQVTGVTAGSPNTVISVVDASPWKVNDWVFIWDMGNITITQTGDIVQASGQITAVDTMANTITVNIPTTYTDGIGPWTSGGTIQNLTRQVILGSNGGDGIKWYNSNGWHNFSPPLTGRYKTTVGGQAQYLFGAQFIISYRGYLLFFNTDEGKTLATSSNYQNRMRRSAAGTPYYASPVASTQGTNANSFSQLPGFGGFTDSPINEELVSARFCRDELIVSHVTHDVRLDFTGNPALLFTWARVNDQFGCESRFSMINLDTQAAKISADGITKSQGIETIRMDNKVPDLIYRLSNTDDGRARVAGYRNFVSQVFKWCCVIPQGYPSYLKFPNAEIVYNYLLDSWSLNKTYRTCYNQFQIFYDRTWRNAKRTWASSNFPWNSLQSRKGNQISVVGNSQGYFHILDETQITSQSFNDRAYRVTSVDSSHVLSVPNHSFKNGDYVYITLMTGSNAAFNDMVGQVQFATGTGFNLINAVGNVLTLSAQSVCGGCLAVVDNFEYHTKKFYVGGNEGLQTRIGYVDIFFEAQDIASTMSVDVILDDNNAPSLTTNFSLLRPSKGAGKIFKRVYINSMAQAIQLKLYYSNEQMFNYQTGSKQFVLHGLTLWFKQSGRLVRYTP